MKELLDFKDTKILSYVTKKLSESPNYGSTMLNKALYFIDNYHKLKYGSPVSSFRYVKREFGPTPDIEFIQLRDQLIQSGYFELKNKNRFGYVSKQLVSNSDVDVSEFTPSEIAIMDEVIEVCKPHTGTDLSDFTHEMMAWQLANEGDELPFFTYLLTKTELQEDDISWAKEKINAA